MIRARKLEKHRRTSPSDLHRARPLPRTEPGTQPGTLPGILPRTLPRAQSSVPPRQPQPPHPPVHPPARTRGRRLAYRPTPSFVSQEPQEEVQSLQALPEDELEGTRGPIGHTPVVHPSPANRCAPLYGPPTQLGEHLRIQAETGHRAGVIELRPGLYLVAEVPTETLSRPEFGAAFLVPLVTSIAVDALTNPQTQAAIVQATQHGVQALTRPFIGHQPPHRLPLPAPYPPVPAYAPAPRCWHQPSPESTPVSWAKEEEIAGVLGCDDSGLCPHACSGRHG